MSFQLPDFPWDSLGAARETATAHPDGLVDLSVGTPVDPVPDVVRSALAFAHAMSAATGVSGSR